jgi:hypothetical protein
VDITKKGVIMELKIDGYSLMDAINLNKERMTFFETKLTDCLWQFPDEEKEKPINCIAQLEKTISNLQELNALQLGYNQSVFPEYNGEVYSLQYLIKLMGSLQKNKKILIGALPNKNALLKRSFFLDGEKTRVKDTVYKKYLLDETTLEISIEKLSKEINAVKVLIRKANSREIILDVTQKTYDAFLTSK